MSQEQQDAPATSPAAPNLRSPFVCHALEMGKIIRRFVETEHVAGPDERDEMINGLLLHMISILKHEAEGPIDALILLVCARELVFGIQGSNSPELIEEYSEGVHSIIQKLERYITTATGATLQSQGINLTGRTWN